MKDIPPPPWRTNHLVAIVEGERNDAEMLHSFLRLIGIDAAVVKPDSDALDTIRREVPDVVVVDLDLPALRGLELAREIGQSLPSAGIVFSTRRRISSHERVVRKPYVSVEELLRLAEIVLNR
jgi:DNA-binding response OmpR family regulator